MPNQSITNQCLIRNLHPPGTAHPQSGKWNFSISYITRFLPLPLPHAQQLYVTHFCLPSLFSLTKFRPPQFFARLVCAEQPSPNDDKSNGVTRCPHHSLFLSYRKSNNHGALARKGREIPMALSLLFDSLSLSPQAPRIIWLGSVPACISLRASQVWDREREKERERGREGEIVTAIRR